MFQAQSMCGHKWMIKTLQGQYLSVLKGQVGLTLRPDANAVDWTFKPAFEFGRYYIEHIETGERLVDVVNGGFDCWSVEQEYSGCFAFVGQGGVFRHFDFNIEDQADKSLAETNLALPQKRKFNRTIKNEACRHCQKRLTEYCNWIIEKGC